ncbi:MAG: HigA protein (antitoxin to HigB), partial [uncultured Blastococcus sp.]
DARAGEPRLARPPPRTRPAPRRGRAARRRQRGLLHPARTRPRDQSVCAGAGLACLRVEVALRRAAAPVPSRRPRAAHPSRHHRCRGSPPPAAPRRMVRPARPHLQPSLRHPGQQRDRRRPVRLAGRPAARQPHGADVPEPKGTVPLRGLGPGRPQLRRELPPGLRHGPRRPPHPSRPDPAARREHRLHQPVERERRQGQASRGQALRPPERRPDHAAVADLRRPIRARPGTRRVPRRTRLVLGRRPAAARDPRRHPTDHQCL